RPGGRGGDGGRRDRLGRMAEDERDGDRRGPGRPGAARTGCGSACGLRAAAGLAAARPVIGILSAMQLYSTLARSKVELPSPPGPIRMYFCGPTVYARAHIGNARPFVLGMWLRSWLRERGYDVRLVHN